MNARDDGRPDPTAEPDAGPAEGARSAAGASDKAQNAEVVLDPDTADEEPERTAADEVERLESHNRSTFSSPDESRPR